MLPLDISSTTGVFLLCGIIFTTIFIIGGNILTILAILKKPKLATPSNQFIIGLALADLLVGVCMPYCTVTFFMETKMTNSFWNFFAKCLLSIVPFLTSSFASFLHLITISVDRYMALSHPLKHKVHMTIGRARKLIAVLWLVASLLATIPVYWNRSHLHHDEGCMVRTMTKLYFTCVLLPLYVLFLIILFIMYIGIYRVASANTTDAKKPMLVVSIVIGCFVFSWTPFVICLFYNLDLQYPIDSSLFTLSYFLVTFNSFMNPLIYAWKNKEFRKTFGEFLWCKSLQSANQPPLGNQNNACSTENWEVPVDVIPIE